MRPGNLPALTSLRFFAAAAIVVHHVNGSFGIPKIAASPFGLGVSFFFILSGFILTHVYSKLTDRPHFFLARIARIWPAHVAALALVALLDADFSVGNVRWPAAVVATNLTMTHTWAPLLWFNQSFNPPSWSISTEFAFYAVFPFLIVNFERSWWWKLAATILLLAGLIATSNAMALQPPKSPHDGLNIHSLIYFHPASRLLEFVVGMCAALLWRRWRPMPNTAIATTLEIAAIAAVLTVPLYGWRIYQWLPFLRSPSGEMWYSHAGIILLPAAALIFVMAIGRGLVSRCLSVPALILLGEISYSIYLTHYVFIRVHQQHYEATKWAPDLVLLAMYVLAVLATSYLIWRFIECPARAFVKRDFSPILPEPSAPQSRP